MVIPLGLGYVFLVLYSICLTIIFVYAANIFYLLLKVKKNIANKKKSPPFLNDSELPLVTIQLPVYNEKYVVVQLLDSITGLNYPKEKLEIQILDDSTDETKEIISFLVEKYLPLGFQIVHFHRKHRTGFKAGALRDGLESSKGEFIAIFDADFTPEPDFLMQLLPEFNDVKVGLVQARWKHKNEINSVLTKVQAMGLDGHFLIEQVGRNSGGYFINFNGTAGIFRKTCILDAGNWQEDTLTEDLDLSFRAQLKGWKFIFRSDITCLCELPEKISSWKSQQFRWTKGAVETGRKILPLVWNSSVAPGIKIQSTLHLTVNVVYPLILMASILNFPLLLLKHQNYSSPVSFNWMGIFILTFISSLLIYWFTQNRSERSIFMKISMFPVYLAFSAGLSVNNSKALLSALLKKKSEFVRTPKFHILADETKTTSSEYVNFRMDYQTVFEFVLGIYCFLCAAAAVCFFEFAALPFILLFGTGYLMMGIFSLRQIAEQKQKEIA